MQNRRLAKKKALVKIDAMQTKRFVQNLVIQRDNTRKFDTYAKITLRAKEMLCKSNVQN